MSWDRLSKRVLDIDIEHCPLRRRLEDHRSPFVTLRTGIEDRSTARFRRTLLLETNGCILLIASYSLLRNLCHIRALEDSFHARTSPSDTTIHLFGQGATLA